MVTLLGLVLAAGCTGSESSDTGAETSSENNNQITGTACSSAYGTINGVVSDTTLMEFIPPAPEGWIRETPTGEMFSDGEQLWSSVTAYYYLLPGKGLDSNISVSVSIEDSSIFSEDYTAKDFYEFQESEEGFDCSDLNFENIKIGDYYGSEFIKPDGGILLQSIQIPDNCIEKVRFSVNIRVIDSINVNDDSEGHHEYFQIFNDVIDYDAIAEIPYPE